MREILETPVGPNRRHLGDFTTADCRAAARAIELGQHASFPKQARYLSAWLLRKLAIVMEEQAAAMVRDLEPTFVEDVLGDLALHRDAGSTAEPAYGDAHRNGELT